MQRLLLLTVLFLLAPAARAQVSVNVQIGVPTIRFAAPPAVVVVSPGIQVVPDYDDEVFFVGGAYWCQRSGHWYRAHDHRGGWAVVHAKHVPSGLVKLPPGKYKRFKGGKGHGNGNSQGHGNGHAKHGHKHGRGHGKH